MLQDHIIAKRFPWVLVNVVLYWVMTGIFLAVFIGMFFGEPFVAIPFVIFVAVLSPFTLWYTYQLVITPPVLAEMRGGIMYLYPDRKTTIPVNPLEIQYIGQQKYNIFLVGWIYQSRVAKLTVQTDSGMILLRWVDGVNQVRYALEWLRADAYNAYAAQQQYNQQQPPPQSM